MKDDCRQAWGLRLVDELTRDLVYGARQLVKRPGFTAVAVASLAIGIGANTALFSLVNAVFLSESLADRPEELVNVYRTSTNSTFSGFSYPEFEDLREGTGGVFDEFGAHGVIFGGVQIVAGSGVGNTSALAVTGLN